MSQVQFDAKLRISVDVLNIEAAEQEGEEVEEGDDTSNQGSRRGFAAMDPEKRSEIARKGGESSHGGGRSRRSSNSSEKELEAMEEFLDTHQDLPEKGKREVEEAIERKQEEIDARH